MGAGAVDRLAYEVLEGRGPVALFCGGRFTTRSYWRRNVEVLAAHCRPVVVEPWGHGHSPSPTDAARYHPDVYVEEFDRIRSDLGVDRMVVVGQSMGGALALRYAIAHPGHALAVAFTNAMSAFQEASAWERRSRAAAVEAERLLAPDGRAFLDADPLNPARSRRLEGAHRAALEAEWALHDPFGLAMGYLHTVPKLPVRDRFAELAAAGFPVLLVHGTREEPFAPMAALARSLLPSLEVVTVDAGHATNLHGAEVFNAAVAELLQRVG
ncbi:MAG: alpha/beta hydrolase [Actinobacteria bacterium]|nr:alpha/beta hydrolase [Actinomycetota bacterium]